MKMGLMSYSKLSLLDTCSPENRGGLNDSQEHLSSSRTGSVTRVLEGVVEESAFTDG